MLALSFVSVLAGIHPIDRVDPWTGETIAEQRGMNRDLDRLDPWSGREVTFERARREIDTALPWDATTY